MWSFSHVVYTGLCVVCVELCYLYMHVCNTGSPPSRTFLDVDYNDCMLLHAALCVLQPTL